MPATAADFRKIALALDGTVEGSHMGHTDFRIGGKIFATLGYPDAAFGMVKVSPADQEMLLDAEPEMFKPATGAWGRAGSTLVNLKAANKTTLKSALAAAWRKATTPKPARKSGAKTRG